MRQILYVSTSTTPGDDAHLSGILNQSRHNNALDGVTGLLVSNGKRFMQVLEGPKASVNPCSDRITRDDRHFAIETLIDRKVSAREFGFWSMLHRRTEDPEDIYNFYIESLLSRACDDVRAHFSNHLKTGSAEDVRPVADREAAKPGNTIPLLTFVFGRFHWDEIRKGVFFEASGHGGPVKYIINSSALAELANGGQTDLDRQQCLSEFRNFEHQIHRIAQRERRAYEKDLPLVVIRREDIRGE